MNLLWLPLVAVFLLSIAANCRPYSRDRLSKARMIVGQFLVCCSLSIICAVYCVGFERDHIVNNKQLAKTLSCQQAHSGSVSYVSSLNAESVLIDTRSKAAFAQGHLENALSIPIESNLVEFRELTRGLDLGKTYIVYCQNASCGWAASMAARLNCQGLNSVVLEGGIDKFIQGEIGIQTAGNQ